MKTEHQEENRRLAKNLILLQGRKSRDEMGKIMGVSGATYRNRLLNPESITLWEMRLLCKHFGIDRATFIEKELKIGE